MKAGSDIADYLGRARALERSRDAHDPSMAGTARLAFAASFTAQGIQETLLVKCAERGIRAYIYASPYNQSWQDLLDPNSPLYAHDPQLVIVFHDTRDLLGERYLTPYAIPDDERRRWVDDKSAELLSLVNTIKSITPAKILLHNFEVPSYSPLGILEHKQPFGVTQSIQALNDRLRDIAKDDAQVFLFDYDGFCGRIGKAHVVDPRMQYLADVRLAWSHVPALCDAYAPYVAALLGLSRKCVVVDLDDTLWGGVVGEDGIDGIRLGPDPEGRPFVDVQRVLLSLHTRGIVLAINSRNNEADALAVLRDHPGMLLREEHFAAVRMNWNDKVENLREIAAELKLGLDAMVFVDNDPATRQRVRDALPEVLVVDMPDDPSFYPETLMRLDVFNTLQLTAEDWQKGRYYAGERQRREVARGATTVADHLRSLEMVVTIARATPFTVPRIAQLTQKTNQFNMTSRRYQDEDIARLAASDEFLVVGASVADRFGDNGLTGVAIVEKAAAAWRIDTFLLSCRVIGRRVETVLLQYLIDEAARAGATAIVGELVETAKNRPARSFYRDEGFTPAGRDGTVERWRRDVSARYTAADFITVVVSP